MKKTKKTAPTPSCRNTLNGEIKSINTYISGLSMTSSSPGNAFAVVINNTYGIGRRLGAGNFGEIRIGKNIHTGQDVAVKLESNRAKIPQLSLEYNFYDVLGCVKNSDNAQTTTTTTTLRLSSNNIVRGFPSVFYYGRGPKFSALIMSLLGKNLEEFFNQCNRKFTNKTVAIIAFQIVNIFEYLHSRGIVYRDIKPENFVLGDANSSALLQVHIVDFGLSKQFMDPVTNEHIPYKEGKNLTGTARYMSINTHLGREQSRRDDLEALGYLFTYLLRGALPWQGIQVDDLKERYKMIGQMKIQTSVNSLCTGLSSVWRKYLDYARNLEYAQKPNYEHLIKLFADELSNEQVYVTGKSNILCFESEKDNWVANAVKYGCKFSVVSKPLPAFNFANKINEKEREKQEVNEINEKSEEKIEKSIEKIDAKFASTGNLVEEKTVFGHYRKPTDYPAVNKKKSVASTEKEKEKNDNNEENETTRMSKFRKAIANYFSYNNRKKKAKNNA